MNDLNKLKSRQQKAWGVGDYAKIGQKLVMMSELLCETVDIRAGIGPEPKFGNEFIVVLSP